MATDNRNKAPGAQTKLLTFTNNAGTKISYIPMGEVTNDPPGVIANQQDGEPHTTRASLVLSHMPGTFTVTLQTGVDINPIRAGQMLEGECTYVALNGRTIVFSGVTLKGDTNAPENLTTGSTAELTFAYNSMSETSPARR